MKAHEKTVEAPKRGTSIFKQMIEKKREVRAHLAAGGSLIDLQGKNHSFAQPV